MATIERIRLIHDELVRVEDTLAKPRFQRGILNWFRTSGLKERLAELRQTRFNLAVAYLMAHDEAFATIAKENLLLLRGDRVHFKVQAIGYNLLHSYATRFEGKILNNGHAYCHTVKGNNPIDPFANMRYPAKLQGKVDCFGNIRLFTADTGMAFYKSLPEAFEGTIDSSGNIQLHVKSLETDILANGQTMIDKLIANLLGGEKNRLRTFVSNRDALVSSVDALIIKL